MVGASEDGDVPFLASGQEEYDGAPVAAETGGSTDAVEVVV